MADISILLAILMKNEDVWINIPSQELFDETITALKLIGIEYQQQGGHRIQIISLEGKRKREEEAAKQLAQLQAYQAQAKIHKQMMTMLDSDVLAKIKFEPDPPEKNSFSDKIKKLIKGSSSGSS